MKLLVGGGGHADIPLIKAAQRLGYHVITTGNRASDLGHMYSDEYIPADYSEPDEILELARGQGVEAICPCCNDFSAISCAYAANELGLPGHDQYDTSLIIHHKDAYREFALANRVSAPRAKGFGSPEDAFEFASQLSYPLIVKPVDLTGGKGVMRVDQQQELDEALSRSFEESKSGRIVVEEFIEGTRHGFSAFLRNGKVVFHFSDDEYYYTNPYLVSAASTPTSVGNKAIEVLIQQSEVIAGKLNLVDGIFHVQFIMRATDDPVIIEICRRPPGDLYIELVRHATGVDYSEWLVKGFAGLDVSKLEQADVSGFYLRHCVMSGSDGVVEDVVFDRSISSKVIDSMMWWKPGDVIENHLVQKCGIVFMKFDSIEELLQKSAQMQELIKVKLR
jgi:biotin carboxylase